MTKYDSASEEFQLALLLFELIRKRNPNHKKPNFQVWAKHIDRMMRIDNRPPELIEEVIRFCQRDLFWKNNILSTDKLRKQYDRLILLSKGDYKPKVCFLCHHEPTTKVFGKFNICTECKALLNAAPPPVTHWGRAIPKSRCDKSQLEDMILKQKAKERK